MPSKHVTSRTMAVSMAVMAGMLMTPVTTFAQSHSANSHVVSSTDHGHGDQAKPQESHQGSSNGNGKAQNMASQATASQATASVEVAAANQLIATMSSQVQSAQSAYQAQVAQLTASASTTVTGTVYATSTGTNTATSTGTLPYSGAIQTAQQNLTDLLQQIAATTDTQQMLQLLNKASQMVKHLKTTVQLQAKQDKSESSLITASQESLKEVQMHYQSALASLQGAIAGLDQASSTSHRDVAKLGSAEQRYAEIGREYVRKLTQWTHQLQHLQAGTTTTDK